MDVHRAGHCRYRLPVQNPPDRRRTEFVWMPPNPTFSPRHLLGSFPCQVGLDSVSHFRGPLHNSCLSLCGTAKAEP